MKTLVLANQKGGVGKSAVATLLAHYFAQKKHRVLAIDLDHQGNFTQPLALSTRPVLASITADRLLTTPGVRVAAEPFVLVPANDALMGLERQPTQHTPFAQAFRSFLRSAGLQFDVCIIDTNPNPDIRVIAALASADYLLSPIQLNQEAIDGVRALLHHQRVGYHKIKAVLNPKLTLLGLLPTLVEPTPFQRANFVALIERHHSLMISLSDKAGDFARIPRRSSITEAQAEGLVLWEMKKTAARETWAEIESSIRHLAGLVVQVEARHAV
jgi:chromosome partitioning protein